MQDQKPAAHGGQLTVDELIAFQELLRDLRKPKLTKADIEELRNAAMERRIEEYRASLETPPPARRNLLSWVLSLFRKQNDSASQTSVYAPGTAVIPGEPIEQLKDRLKEINDNLIANIRIVHDGTRYYWETGHYPAPYYAHRIAVTLRKRKLYAEEVELLEAFSALFSDGIGRRYQDLAERVAKAQAKWDRYRQQ